ncbi:hypothetical protein GT348_07195 [Aristophania vespae]|uniref:DUF1311 domain-containing protein n=1 Tax=Aristophania vespae TaxID=2697033 RepID=A0A6P1NF08_9PROT|nr:hypothetical protein [Aristophania vespae]QHI96048.1 hypothetical protein GT348_07195 [Aristophania vespae]
MSKLLKTMLGAVALTYCVSAHAKPFTNEDAIAEANSFKLVCGNHDKARCEHDQKIFIKEYQSAYAGVFEAQREVAYAIWKYRDPENAASQIGACAWQTIAMSSSSNSKVPSDDDRTKKMCQFATADKKSSLAIQKRVEQIKKIIAIHTVYPADFEVFDFIQIDYDKDVSDGADSAD